MIGPGSSINRTEYTPSVVVLTLIIPSHHRPWSPLHGVAVSAKPIGVRYAASAGFQETLALTPTKLPLCRAYPHPAVQAVWFGGTCSGVPAQQREHSWRDRSDEGPFPVSRTVERVSSGCCNLVHHLECISHITSINPPRPRTDWCPVIFSASSR